MNNSPFLKLIGEATFNEYDYFVVNEDRNGMAIHEPRIRGPYIAADVVNENGRMYPGHVVAEAVEKYIEEEINTGGGLGELEHPSSPKVNLERACHKCVSLKQQKNIWVGESVILTGTPTGDIVNSLLKHKARIGMSTRGFVKYKDDMPEQKDKVNVVDKFILVCIDVVANPSIGQYLDGVLEEKDYMINNHGMVVEAAYSRLEKDISKLPDFDKELQRQIINKSVFKFLDSIRN